MSKVTIGARVVQLVGAVLLLLGAGGGARQAWAADTVAHEWVQAGATLLDVRTAGEFAGGHLDGAKNIPIDELAQRLAEVPKDKKVVVYCAAGVRSAQGAQILTQAGYTVHDLGAMSAW